MPRASSFLNLVDDLKDRFPELSRTELTSLGGYIWKQLTWEEKYPYMVQSWHTCRRHGRVHGRSDQVSLKTPELKLAFIDRMMRYAAENYTGEKSGGIKRFLRFMSKKVWNQLISLSVGCVPDTRKQEMIEKANFSSILRTMRELRKPRDHRQRGIPRVPNA